MSRASSALILYIAAAPIELTQPSKHSRMRRAILSRGLWQWGSSSRWATILGEQCLAGEMFLSVAMVAMGIDPWDATMRLCHEHMIGATEVPQRDLEVALAAAVEHTRAGRGLGRLRGS